MGDNRAYLFLASPDWKHTFPTFGQTLMTNFGEHPAARADLGEQRRGDLTLVPDQRTEIHKLGTAGIGYIRYMYATRGPPVKCHARNVSIRLEAPMTLCGFTALSVGISTNVDSMADRRLPQSPSADCIVLHSRDGIDFQ